MPSGTGQVPSPLESLEVPGPVALLWKNLIIITQQKQFLNTQKPLDVQGLLRKRNKRHSGTPQYLKRIVKPI
jgi:hypothetical protein